MSYTREDVRLWLQTLAGGTLSLLVDNARLARFAIDFLEPVPPDFDGHISANFTWKEFLWSDTAASSDTITNVPTDPDVLINLKQLAEVMESVRVICANYPITINSAYRSPDTNQAVGGVPDSAHLVGCACDFVCPSFGDVSTIVEAVEPLMVELGIDQLIHEGTWVHLAIANPPAQPRYECFAI